MDFLRLLLQSAESGNSSLSGSAVISQLLRRLMLLALVMTPFGSARAGWREDLGTFRIGLSASDTRSVSPDDLDKVEAAYAKVLGMPVSITALRDYPALIDAHVSGRIEYAMYTSTAYASAWLLCECVEPLVAPVLTNGATGIRSALIVNAGSTFTRLDLNGIRVGIPGKNSLTGYAIPLVSYTVGTRSLNQDEEFFVQLDDLETTTAAFAQGKLEAFFGWAASNSKALIASAGIMNSGNSKQMVFAGQTTEIKVPWLSPLLRFGPHAIRRDLNAEAKAALLTFLNSADMEVVDLLSITQAGDIEQLVPARHAEYELAIQATKVAAAAAR